MSDPLDPARQAIERGAHSEACRLLLPLANTGSSEAQHLLSSLQPRPRLVRHAGWPEDFLNDPEEPARQAIEREEYSEAYQLLLPLAETGSPEAQYLLGTLYFCSDEVELTEACAWFERAAAQDHPEAICYLASWQPNRALDTPKNETRRVLLTRAAELGSLEAQYALGREYAVGEDDWPLDPALGRHWYGRAAAGGHADAQYNYALMLLLGEGGPVDSSGEEWMKRAAALQHPDALSIVEDYPSPMNLAGFQIHGLDHVQLAMPAGQEAAARDFYTGILRLAEVPKPPNLAQRGGVWFEAGTLRLHVGVEADFRPAKKAHPALLVHDLPALTSYLQRAGIAVVTDEPLEGYERIYVADPFGNRLELLEPIPPACP